MKNVLVSGEQNYPPQAQEDRYLASVTQAELGAKSPELQPQSAYLGFQVAVLRMTGISRRVWSQIDIS